MRLSFSGSGHPYPSIHLFKTRSVECEIPGHHCKGTQGGDVSKKIMVWSSGGRPGREADL